MAITAQRALAVSLLELPLGGHNHNDDGDPQLHLVLADARHDEGPSPIAQSFTSERGLYLRHGQKRNEQVF